MARLWGIRRHKALVHANVEMQVQHSRAVEQAVAQAKIETANEMMWFKNPDDFRKGANLQSASSGGHVTKIEITAFPRSASTRARPASVKLVPIVAAARPTPLSPRALADMEISAGSAARWSAPKRKWRDSVTKVGEARRQSQMVAKADALWGVGAATKEALRSMHSAEEGGSTNPLWSAPALATHDGGGVTGAPGPSLRARRSIDR